MGRTVRLGLLGLGTVGKGVYRLLEANRQLIEQRIGASIEIAKIAVRDPGKDRGITCSESMLTSDAAEVVRDPNIDIVVELIGGTDVARGLISDAIAAGKHVVTANKALLAEHGGELRSAARREGVLLAFEGSVGGGIPVIKTIQESLAANRVLSIYGIINGTSNYILTKMRDERRPYADVLVEAQEAGYAETDPTFDVGGVDSAHKLAILVNLAFGLEVSSREIYTEGITEISPVDIEFGREFGYTLKLLAIAKSGSGSLEARVHPTLVPDHYPIAQVGGVYNAVQIVEDGVGDLMLYGRGAGAMPTASAVLGDVIDICRSRDTVPAPSFISGGDARIQPIEAVASLHYLRFMVEDKPGVLSEISGVLGRHDISIESVIQKGRDAGRIVPLVIMTHTAVERDIQNALLELDQLSAVALKTVLIRVEAED